MNFIFKQQVSFGKGRIFSLGSHEVDAQIQQMSYFKKLLECGLVYPDNGKAEAPSKPVPLHELQKKAIDQQKESVEKKASAAASQSSGASDPGPAVEPVSVSKRSSKK
jgi:hypothetical protein